MCSKREVRESVRKHFEEERDDFAFQREREREGKKSSKRRTRSPPGVCGCWCAVPFAVSFGFDARSPIVFVKSKSKRECCWTEERRRKKKRKRLWKRVFFYDDDDDNRLFRALKNGHFLFACFFLCSLFSPSSITLSRREEEDTIPKGLSTDTKRTLCMRLGNDEHER